MQANAGDTALVSAARLGDREAFAGLVLRHRARLIAVCQRTISNPADAEDAAQEAVLQALLSLDSLRQPDRFGPWLVGIGLNVCRRLLREQSGDCWSWDAMLGGRIAFEPASGQPGPDELANAAELAERVRQAVDDLPGGQRSAVLLFYLTSLTYAETAALLGIEVSAVKARLHKARRSLRRRLREVWKEEEMTTEVGSQPVEVRVADVRRKVEVDEPRYHMVMLEEVRGARRLPIWVGQFEGTALAILLGKVRVPRPLTFAFMADLLQASGGQLKEVRIAKLVEGTFYAIAVIKGAGEATPVDARPSDALALALAAGAPIRVEPGVFDASEAHLATHEHPPMPVDAYYGQGTQGAADIVAEVTAKWPGFGRSKSR